MSNYNNETDNETNKMEQNGHLKEMTNSATGKGKLFPSNYFYSDYLTTDTDFCDRKRNSNIKGYLERQTRMLQSHKVTIF